MTTPTPIPVPPCAQPDAPSPLSPTGAPLRWGVVSTGRIAAKVTEDIARLEDAVLHAVSSRREESAVEFAARFGFSTSYHDDDGQTGYQRMFSDPEVDLVYVATPHGQHFEVTKAALQAGKHVLCEKTFTINAREAEELIELARARNLFLMEAMWTRFQPSAQRAWEIVRSGELGDIQWIQADQGFPSPYDPRSRLWDPAAGGGALLDLTVYPITWAIGALGFPLSVSATGALNDDGVDGQNCLTLSYASGAHAQLSSSLLASGPNTATVSGSRGWLRAAAPLHNTPELTIQPLGGDARTEAFEPVGNGYVYELREATRCIQHGLVESPTMPWEHSLNVMRLLDGVRAQLGLRYSNDARRQD